MGCTVKRCDVCLGWEKHTDIYKLYKKNDIVLCDICLHTTVKDLSPAKAENFIKSGEVIYYDSEKESSYYLSLFFTEGLPDMNKTPYKFELEGSKIKPKPKFKELKLPLPKDTYEHLDKFVVGQENTKRVLSVAVYNHHKRLFCKSRGDTEIEKSNILMMGPTGVGKTYMVNLISKQLDVPYICFDANSLTQSGYVGSSVEDMLKALYNKAGGDIGKAQKGIILVDEIDKIASKPNSNGRDISGKGVQESLLKIIEGGEFTLDMGQGQKDVTFDTSDTLFIVAGAFADLAKKLFNNSSRSKDFIGGGSIETLTKDDIYRNVTTTDLIEFGIIPELVGRLAVRTMLSPLTTDDLVEIMSSKEGGALDQYKASLAFDNIDLKVSRKSLELIAEIVNKNGTGARGLGSVFEELLLDIQFDAPGNTEKRTYTITNKMIKSLEK